MASPKEAVSIVTAAALVAAPVGSVAVTYSPAYASDGDGHTLEVDGKTLPANYAEARAWAGAGQLDQATIDVMQANGLVSASEHGMLSQQINGNVVEEQAPEPVQEETPAPEETTPEPGEETDTDNTAGEGGETGDDTVGGEDTGDGSGTETETPGEGETPEPENPDVPDQPTDPENPDQPTDPENPDQPTDPTEPTDPENPDQPTEPTDPSDPTDPDEPAEPEVPEIPDAPGNDPAAPIQPDNPAVRPTTPADEVAGAIKAEAQTPLKQVAVSIPTISFTHIDNSAYVARHYSEDLTTEKFISLVGESARSIAAESDLYASVMIAQAILESASGNSTLAQAPNNNLFGIKGTYNGNSVKLPTREDDGSGATYTIMSDFRQYDTVDESLSDYADLLSNSMGDFYAGARKSNTDSFVDACDFLVGRYATDIFYSEKLQDLIETYDLTRFDMPLTYELRETFVLPVKDEVTGLDKYVDPVTQRNEYEELVAEYQAYLARTSEYQASLARWEEQMAAAEELYHVPVYLEKPSIPETDSLMQQHQDAIDAERFEGFDELIAAGEPLPVREGRTLHDLTSLANSFLGVPYLWGGTTPAGFDCSGLVQYCYREVFNIELPRTTYYQCEVGVEVPFEELLPGDLLFFADGGDVHHVAMYLGDGYYVEAPHTGDVVKITAMNDKLPDFAKRVVEVRDISLDEYSDEQLAAFVDREKYLQEREQRRGVSDESLAELTEWLQGLTF